MYMKVVRMSNLAFCVGPTSNRPFHGITEFIDGIPLAVEFSIPALTKIFLEDISPDKYNIDFDEWRRDRKSGVVLTTPECMKFMRQEFEKNWSFLIKFACENGTLHLFNDDQYKQTKQREISKKLSSYVNNLSMHDWDYAMSTDLFHGFDTHIKYVVIWIMLFSHCVLKNPVEKTTAVFEAMGLPWLTKAAIEYMDSNRSRKLSVKWALTSNGHNLKLICNVLYFGFNELAWTAHEKLELQLQECSDIGIMDIVNNNIVDVEVDMSLFIPSLKIAAQYVAHKHLRRAFSKFWSSKVEKNYGVGLPPTVRTLKYHLRKGFNVLRTFSPESVRFCLWT